MTKRRQTHVWIVQANTTIVAVFSTEGAADDYAFSHNSEDRIAAQDARSKNILYTRTHYGWTKHELRSE